MAQEDIIGAAVERRSHVMQSAYQVGQQLAISRF
jgi:hypothetical protein